MPGGRIWVGLDLGGTKLMAVAFDEKFGLGFPLLADTDHAVAEAWDAIMASCKAYNPKAVIEGVTVQDMAKPGVEVIIGMSTDPQFGPVILFGLGGQLVEVFKDRALGLPPLNTTLARRMMERTKETLEVKDDAEWKIIQPLVQKVMDARMATFSGMGRGFFRTDTPLRAALSNSFAFGGSNAVLAFRAVAAQP